MLGRHVGSYYLLCTFLVATICINKRSPDLLSWEDFKGLAKDSAVFFNWVLLCFVHHCLPVSETVRTQRLAKRTNSQSNNYHQ